MFLSSPQHPRLTGTSYSISWLLTQPLLPFLMQVAPASKIYRTIMTHGIEDCIEIIEWIQGPKLQQVFDYALWEEQPHQHIWDIVPSRFLDWLQVWLEIGSEFAAERFFDLEEETLVLITSKLFDIFPVGVTPISDELAENAILTPDNRFYVRLSSPDKSSYDILKPFLDAIYAYDMKYAGSIFSHASMLVRTESLEDALRWRAGRIADEGFLQKEEAMDLLSSKAARHKDLKKWILESREIAQKRAAIQKKQQHIPTTSLAHLSTEFPELFENVHRLLCKMPPPEGIRYITQATKTEEMQALLGTNHNVPPEQFYTDEDFLNEAAEKILGTCQHLLIQHDFSTQAERSPQLLIEHALARYATQEEHVERFVDLKSHLARLANMVFSATSSFAYNEVELQQALLIVRGAVNIGLEVLAALPEEYHLVLTKNDTVEQCVDFINELGVDTIFYIGWESIKNIEVQIKKSLRSIALETISTPAIQIVCRSINRFVPQYPLCLNALSSTLPTQDVSLTQETKPLETQDEIEKILTFIQNLEFMSQQVPSPKEI